MKTIKKAVCLFLALTMFANMDSHALATLTASQNINVKREILAVLQRTKVRYADSEDAKRLLRANNASCILLSSGTYLVSEDMLKDDLTLLRAIVHEDIEALMQILEKKDRDRYQAISGLIYKYFPPETSEITDRRYVNHVVARAFEWLTLIADGLIVPQSVPDKEKEFVGLMGRIVGTNRHSYFTREFWDVRERGLCIKEAVRGGMVFYQALSSCESKKALLPGLDNDILFKHNNDLYYRKMYGHCVYLGRANELWETRDKIDWEYEGYYEESEKICEELKAMGLNVTLVKDNVGELPTGDQRHFATFGHLSFLVMSEEDEEILYDHLLFRNDPVFKDISAICESINPVYDRKMLIKLYSSWDGRSEKFTGPGTEIEVYESEGDYVDWETAEEVTSNYYDRKANGLNALGVRISTVTVKKCVSYIGRHFFVECYYKRYSMQPDAFHFVRIYLSVGQEAFQIILKRPDLSYDGNVRQNPQAGTAQMSEEERFVKDNVRVLGQGDRTARMGNKEAGFTDIAKMGLPFPPGIAISEKLVLAIRNASEHVQKIYEHFIRLELAAAGVSGVNVSVRSNPKRSMPGLLKTQNDIMPEYLVQYIVSVADSWELPAAKDFRLRNKISDGYDLPVIVQKWVKTRPTYYSPDKNRDRVSYAAGVFTTRDPNTGDKGIFGTYIEGRSGDEIMSGADTGMDICELAKKSPSAYARIVEAAQKIEEKKMYPQEMEFAIEDGDIYFLQTRAMVFSPKGELRFLDECRKSGVMSEARSIAVLQSLQERLHRRRIYKACPRPDAQSLSKGLAVTSGAMSGHIVWTPETMDKFMEQGKPVIFLSSSWNRNFVMNRIFDYPASGLITLYGSGSSHEAVLTRISGIPSLIKIGAQYLRERRGVDFERGIDTS